MDEAKITDEQRARDFWHQFESGQYMDALTTVWQICPLKPFQWLLSQRTSSPSMTIQQILEQACREAVKNTRKDFDQGKILQWAEVLLKKGPPAALTVHDDRNELTLHRQKLIRAYLAAVQLAVSTDWTSGRLSSASNDAVVELAKRVGVTRGFLCHVAETFVRPETQDQQHKVPLTGFLVRGQEGFTVRLTLELVPNGGGELYPTLPSAWIYCHQDFAESLETAWQIIAKPYVSEHDVRWHIVRYDGGTIPEIEGRSMGAAFAIGLAVLLARAEIGKEAPWYLDAQLVALDQVGVTATFNSDQKFGEITKLWEKLGSQALNLAERGLLRQIVVVDGQPDVPADYYKDTDVNPFQAFSAENLPAALRMLAEHDKARRAVERHETERCNTLDVLHVKAPFSQLYQVLPLLREVKREKLPRDRRSGDKEGDDAESGFDGLRASEILRWEESLREEQVTYERVELQAVLDKFAVRTSESGTAGVPRFVVLGPPGSGKTTLGKYLIGQVARKELRINGRPFVPAFIRLREWETRNATYPLSLPDALAEIYRTQSGSDSPDRLHWEQWLRRGDVWVFLDGLDEISGRSEFNDIVKRAIAAYSHCPMVVTCRTVSAEQHQRVCPEFPVFTLDGLGRVQQENYIRAFPAQNSQYNAQSLTEQIRQRPMLQPLATNPLLLSILCFVADDPAGLSLPATRSALYGQAVDKLLDKKNQRARANITFPTVEPLPYRKRALLELTALRLFAEAESRQLNFTVERFEQVLQRVLQTQDWRFVDEWANVLRADFTQNYRIMTGDDETAYSFIHLTIQEFLTAAALAQMINKTKTKWDTEIEFTDRTWTIRELVDKKAWDPRWQEVIVLLAGQLNDPVPLLEMLSDVEKDDLFRHRLCLAALCLPELQINSTQSHATE